MAVDPSAYTCGMNRCRGADAAFAAAAPGAQLAVGKIARVGVLGTKNIPQSSPYHTIVGEAAPLASGQRVFKTGRTTGWTTGFVEATCVDVGQVFPSRGMTRCEYGASYGADEGDSGGPVFLFPHPGYYTDDVILAGIHSSRDPIYGTAYFSKLDRIKSDLGGTWEIVGGIPSLWADLAGATEVQPGAQCVQQYTADVTGGVPPYTYAWSSTGNITSNSGPTISAYFPTAGQYLVEFSATDAAQTTVTRSLTITVSYAAGVCEA